MGNGRGRRICSDQEDQNSESLSSLELGAHLNRHKAELRTSLKRAEKQLSADP